MKNFTHSILFVLFVAILLLSCSKTTLKVINVKEAKTYEDDALIYALPQTVLQIEIEVKRTIVKHGQFHEYAEKYLTIKGVPSKDIESWRIEDIRIGSRAEVDSNHIYLIYSSDVQYSDLISLSSTGLIQSVNFKNAKKTVSHENTNTLIEYDDLGGIQYKELSVYENFSKPTGKKYKRVKRDSGYVRVPILQDQISKKSIDEKAKEAAHFIVKLRKRRFKLIAGMYDKFYSGAALEIALKELKREEEEYLSLFIGKTYEEVHTYDFTFTPDNISKLIPNMICRFSPAKGIIDKDSREGTPILLETISSERTNALSQFIEKKNTLEKRKKNRKKNIGLYYRIPEETNIRILKNKNEIASRRMPVAQYGVVTRLPVDLLLNNFSIEFDSEYGNIRKISK